MNVGANRLRELRKKARKSQEVVGGLINVSQSRMSDFENGICAIPSDILNLLADYYNVTTDYILGRSNVPFNIQDLGISEVDYFNFMKYSKLTPNQKKLVDAMLTAACDVVK